MTVSRLQLILICRLLISSENSGHPMIRAGWLQTEGISDSGGCGACAWEDEPLGLLRAYLEYPGLHVLLSKLSSDSGGLGAYACAEEPLLP